MFYELFLTLLALIVVVVLFDRLRGRRTRSLLYPIPTVPFFDWPLFGSGVSLLFSRPWEALTTWLDQYGGPRHLLRFNFMTLQFFVVGDLKLIQHILGTNSRNYPKDNRTFAPFMDLLGQGLVTSEGDRWERQRRLLAPAFRGSSLQHVASASFEASQRMLERLKNNLGAGTVIEWNGEFRAMTLQVIAGSIMSLSAIESDAVLPRLYLPIVDEANKRTWHPWRWLIPNHTYTDAVRQLNEFVTRIIEQRWKGRAVRYRLSKAGHIQLDILDRLLFAMFSADAQKSASVDQMSEDANAAIDSPEEEQTGFDISDSEAASESCPAWATSQLRDEIKTFLLAGHETSSLMLTWALYEITQNPEVEERVYQEACNVFPSVDFETMPAYKDFRGLSYTEAVLKEALRKYSVVPVVTREAIETETIDGVTIPAGCTITIPIRYIHHRTDLWTDPESFRPERWEQRVNAWQFLGFLQGPRFCIGQQFALLEGKIVLAMIVRLFKLSSCRETDATPHRFVIPVHPDRGMNLFVKLRT